MNNQTTPGPVKARESLSKLGSFQNDTKNHSNFKPPLTDGEEVRKALQADAESQERAKAPEQHDEEDEAEDTAA